MKTIHSVILLLLGVWAIAQPPAISPYIKTDQFGYLCNARKVAVISDPVNGYNGAESFTPGTGIDNYQVRRWSDNSVVLSGTVTAWNGGAVHVQSGDRGWYFDFSPVAEAGAYYIFDVANNVGSGQFFIGSNAYDETLKAVLRTYYYARCNFAKVVPYAAPEYTDAAAYEGSNQDRHARSSLDKNNAATERDVSGGWFDAGDMNKYVTFSVLPMLSLMDSYNRFPQVFGDNNGIPESGNGLADILDEIKWELEWLKKMQDGTGTNGLFLKVGADNYSCTNSPPSADVCSRYYIPECTSSTICGATIFAAAHRTFSSVPGQNVFAADMLARAQNAWARAAVSTSGWTDFQTACDNGDIKSGDADMDATAQMQNAVIAAVYLYAATGSGTYKTFVESRYNTMNPVSTGWWGPYDTEYGRALLFYTTLPGITSSVGNSILSSKSNTATGMGLTEYNSSQDLYRSHMPDAQYHWGSNQIKAYIGAQQIDYVTYGLNVANHALYKELAAQYLHYIHGVNPLGMTFLSNMYDLYGENCANEIYHGWFGDGTPYDNAQTSPYGPPPGFIAGGPNASFSIGSISPPAGQPPQKSYKDWNTGWNASTNMNENSWEITEPAIYYQAAYINLLASVLGTADNPACEAVILATATMDFSATKNERSVLLRWTASEDVEVYEVQLSEDGQNYRTIYTETMKDKNVFQWIDRPDSDARKLFYRIKLIKSNGQESYSRIQIVPWGDRQEVIAFVDHQSQTIRIAISQEVISNGVKIKVLNSNGMVIVDWPVVSSPHLSIPVNDWPAGYYFLQVTKDRSQPVIKKLFIGK